MKKFLALLVTATLAGCGVVSSSTTTSNTTTVRVGCSAMDGGKLPDPSCTPGVTDNRVTQANIQQTICVRGYTATVRPPASYTTALKKRQIAEYGYTDTNLHDYEEDHLISLELGGNPTDPRNLWPEPGRSPNPKDKIENMLHRLVCDGKITLAQAQQEISTNWTKISNG